MNEVIFPTSDHHERLRQKTGPPQSEGMGVYIHVPFCRQKCLYCDFASVPLDHDDQIFSWQEALCCEIEWIGKQNIPLPHVSTMYWGGGTPSLLPITTIDAILRLLTDTFDFSHCREWTVEVNPESLDINWLHQMHNRGLHRVSCGLQSLDDVLLRFLGRAHDADQARQALALLSGGPRLRWSIDLMCGIPGQTIKGLLENLEEILESSPSHLSVYPLTIEENTPLARKSYRKILCQIDEELVVDMLIAAEEFLSRQGFIHYEIANYCREGEICLHNLGYWQRTPYLGLGPAAASFINSTRSENLRDLKSYADVWKIPLCSHNEPLQRPSTESGDYIDDQEACREDIMLGTRLLSAFDLSVWRKKWADTYTGPLESIIDEHVARGTIQRQKDLIQFSPVGRWLANSFWRDIVFP